MNRDRHSFTLIELLMVLAIIGLLASLLIPVLGRARATANVVRATVELRQILVGIDLYRDESRGKLPLNLTNLFRRPLVDPWGNDYRYQELAAVPRGKWRKDRNLVPINSRFDLFSVGRDGKSSPPVTAAGSRDDVIVADDGEYIGLAKDY